MSQNIPPKGFYIINMKKFESIVGNYCPDHLYSSGTNKGNLWIRPRQGHTKWCHLSCMPSKKRLKEQWIYLGTTKPNNLPDITEVH